MPVPNKDAIVNNNMQHKLCYVNIVLIMFVPHNKTVWYASDHSMQIVLIMLVPHDTTVWYASYQSRTQSWTWRKWTGTATAPHSEVCIMQH